jgi:copper homeostasis protein
MAFPGLGLEIPAFGASAARDAVNLGATRIELNALGSYSEGGLTPSLEDLKQITSAPAPRVPLRIMIRPRGPPFSSSSSEVGESGKRDFLYSDEEFEAMEASVETFKDSGLLDVSRGDGFVFGILREDDEGEEERARKQRCWVDSERCARLVQAARPFRCVFHRAFDEIVSCDDAVSDDAARPAWETGLEAVAACGFDGILTSGGLGKAVDNIGMLEKIIPKAQALRVEIIVGGWVRTANIGELTQRLALKQRASSVYLHSACLLGDGGEEINPKEVQGILAQLA